MNSNGGRFSDGLIFGLILGGAAVFLLGTENGKKLFKVLTEEGSHALSSILEDIQQYEEEFVKSKKTSDKQPLTIVEAESLDFKEAPSDSQYLAEDKKESDHSVSSAVKEKPSRRFFKKSSK